MQFIDGQSAAGGQCVAPRAADAVLVVDSGGRRYAFELARVAEIRGVRNAPAPGARMRAVLDRNGIRIPVFGLGDTLDTPNASGAAGAGAVIVLDLPDRLAGVAVDAVCEVRIPHTRSFVPAVERAETLCASVAWVALWDGGEAPVLDLAAWLLAAEADSQAQVRAAP